jgi:thermitase
MTMIPPTSGPPVSGPEPLAFSIDQDDHTDLRCQEAKDSDSSIVQRQLDLLGPDDRNQQRLREIIAQLQRDQERPRLRDAIPFDLLETDADTKSFVLVARNRLVAQAPPSGELPVKGYQPVRPVVDYEPGKMVRQLRESAPSGPTSYISTSAKTPGDLAADARKLTDLGVPASLDYIVPLGHVVKGDDFPEPPAEVNLTYPPPNTKRPANGTGLRVRIAMIDTGIAGERRQDGWLDDVKRGPANIDQLDIVPPFERLDWFAGHGTFTAGVVQQMAPYSEIVAYRFVGRDGIGTEKDIADAVLRAAQQAAEDGVHLVINMSVGTPAVGGLPPLALGNAIEFVRTNYPDVVMVASAGNNGTDELMYPAAFPGVVAVGALDGDYQPAAFSSFGPWVDCSCVGVGVVSTFVRGTLPPEPIALRADVHFGSDAFALWSGTSFSAPQISGAIARLCEMNGCTPPVALAALLAQGKQKPDFGIELRDLLPGTSVSSV